MPKILFFLALFFSLGVSVSSASAVPGWVVASWESEALGTGPAGHVVPDSLAYGNWAVSSTVAADSNGNMLFGPYSTSLVDGRSYVAGFRMKISDKSTGATKIGLIDVYNEITGFREYREISANDFAFVDTYQDLEIPFVKSGSSIQFRVFFYDVADLTVDRVIVTADPYPVLLPSDSGLWTGLPGGFDETLSSLLQDIRTFLVYLCVLFSVQFSLMVFDRFLNPSKNA